MFRSLWRRIKSWFRPRRKPSQQPKPKPVEQHVELPADVSGYSLTKTDIRGRTLMYYHVLYNTMQIRNPSVVERAAATIRKNESVYKNAEKLTGVDWRVIGVIHYMEAGCNMDRQILNGELYWKKTRLVPKGKGPWASWEASCIDAFKYHKFDASNVASTLKYLERYNGLGYVKKGINSPYIWSYSNHYLKGKYIRDGVYSPTAVSKQVGAAPLLKMLGYGTDNR